MKVWKFAKPILKGGKQVVRYTAKHHNWILSVLAMLGLAGTAYLWTKATIKAVKICEEKQVKGTKEVVKTVWKLFLPGIGVIFVTTLAIGFNAHLNARNLATVTGMWAASQADTKLIKEKVKEIVGEGKAQKIENEVSREKIHANPPPSEDFIVKTGHGNQLFMFGWTGVYLRTSPEWIDLQFEKFNKELDSDMTQTIQMHRLIELLTMPHCDSGDAYWDKVEMKRMGYDEVSADCRCIEWMEVNGKQEMVSIIETVPKPTGF